MKKTHASNNNNNNNNDDDDINDIFDNLLFGEELANKSGFEEGFNAGKCQSISGYHLGYHRASELSARLGFYSIVIKNCLDNSDNSSKINNQAIILDDLINKFPRDNTETIDIIKIFENIKLKFNRLCSLAKINISYSEFDNQLNF
ncbi:uncharacterized protein LOC122850302 [Aphidius gifuensis]|uniref:uncharacterized protein LOC122850302 n=1 Tax=Aphidius gifuensis TaxID=684658 RepID=UPI001CDB6135|nr:uncharacterized protein LOC122850302 [Aphidius gifuensis]